MNHISREQWDAFFDGSMSEKDTQKLLEHTAQCTYCADCMAGRFPEEQMISPPKGLTDEIRYQAEKKHVLPHFQKHMELLAYGCRVTVGVVLSILLVFQITLPSQTRDAPKKDYHIAAKIYEKTEMITAALNTWNDLYWDEPSQKEEK
ncbi:MAG: hypothetical protein PUB10_00570 [Clostridiales bacterium]|nr:hypothetical protein [Clostridiales bacterium]